MKSTTTTSVLVAVRGPHITYGNLRFIPNLMSTSGSVDIDDFSIRRGDDRFLLSDLPLAKALYQKAKDDVIYHTFENEDDLMAYFEIDFEIKAYDERFRLNLRAVEKEGLDDLLFYEVEDEGGDWIPMENVDFIDLMPESFRRIMETHALEQITDHNLELLPMDDES